MNINGTEENPGKNGQPKSNTDGKNIFETGQQPALGYNVQVVSVSIENNRGHNIKCIQKSPNDKGPVGPMPKTTYNKYDKNIPDLHPPASPAAAKGYVQVIPEPGRERNMPAPPEFGYIPGKIRE